MAVKRTVADASENETASVKTTAEKETKYSVDKLRQNSIALFGVTQSTFDGAMYGHDNKEYTINEAKAILDGWLYGKGGKK